MHTYLDTEDGPLAQLEDKSESTHVEKGINAIKRVGTNSVDPTTTSKAKGLSRNESILITDLPHGGDDHASPKSYTRGEAYHQTPDDGSRHTGRGIPPNS